MERWFLDLRSKRRQFTGILVGLLGTLILILKGADLHPNQNYWFALLIIIASIGYAFNANLVKKYLSDLDALAITTGNFLLLFIPAIIVLSCTDFFTSFEATQVKLTSSRLYRNLIGCRHRNCKNNL